MNTSFFNKFLKDKSANHKQSQAIQEIANVTPEANVSIPSEEAVEEAKEWVDENEK